MVSAASGEVRGGAASGVATSAASAASAAGNYESRAAELAAIARRHPVDRRRLPDSDGRCCTLPAPAVNIIVSASVTAQLGDRGSSVIGHAQNPPHAIEQRSAGRRHRHRRRCRCARFRAPRAPARIRPRSPHTAIAMSSQQCSRSCADPVRQPPHRGVIEQQRLGHRLQHVHRVVVTTDVRELVREDRFDLRAATARRARRSAAGSPAATSRRRSARRPAPIRRRARRREGRGDTPAGGRRSASATTASPARDAMQPPHVPPAAGHARQQQQRRRPATRS